MNRRQWMWHAGIAASALGMSASRSTRSVWAQSNRWADERQVGNLMLRSEFSLQNIGGLVQEVVDLQGEIGETLNLSFDDRPVQIHFFASRSSYIQHLKPRIPNAASRQALYVRGTDADRVYVYRSRALETDVRHETTHAWLHAGLPYVPMWFDEGVAEYFEPPASQRVSHNDHAGAVRRSALFGWKPDLPRLEAMKTLTEMGEGHYRDAWAVVHFLIHGPEAAHREMFAYLDDIRSGRRPTPMSQRLSAALPGWEKQVATHHRHWK